jgi:hypothetical protein
MFWIAKANQIATARQQLMARLKDEATVIIPKKSIPTRGGALESGNIYQINGLWAHCGDTPSQRATGHLWEISFGTVMTLGEDSGPSIEFNLPKCEYRDRYTTGRVVVDAKDKLYLGHKGLLSGGAAPVKLTAFEASIRGFVKQEIQWPNSRSAERIFVIAGIDAPNFFHNLRLYVEQAERLRQLQREGKLS